MSKSTLAGKWAAIGVAVVLALAPFHALLTVWAGSNLGHYDLWRLWPEFLMLPLVVLAGIVLYNDKKLRRMLLRNPLVWVIAAYALLHIGLGLWAVHQGEVNGRALEQAIIINMRLPLIFMLAWMAATKVFWLRQEWWQLLLLPAMLVIGFGLSQIILLPHDVLRHAGYGPTTIMPYQTVDQKEAYVRVQSTLRGSNPLGAYLVIVASAAIVGLLVAVRNGRDRGKWIVALLAILLVLFYTYSRSAYLGTAVALGAVTWLMVSRPGARRFLILGAASLILIIAGSFVVLKNNDRFQNTFFHTDEHSNAPDSSNHDRLNALKQAVGDIAREPLGRGPGTAGPASAHNVPHSARIAENYFLQIGQEVGWLGLALFIYINVAVAGGLWRRRNEPLAVVLICSWIGITIISMLSHAWTDDTLSLVWWGLAGIATTLPAKLQEQAHG